jgi:hypothetical protein
MDCCRSSPYDEIGNILSKNGVSCGLRIKRFRRYDNKGLLFVMILSQFPQVRYDFFISPRVQWGRTCGGFILRIGSPPGTSSPGVIGRTLEQGEE